MVFTAIYTDEIALAMDRGGETLMREKAARLSDEERQLLHDALDAVPA